MAGASNNAVRKQSLAKVRQATIRAAIAVGSTLANEHSGETRFCDQQCLKVSPIGLTVRSIA